MKSLLRRWPVLFLAFAPILPLWRAIFLGEAIGPWDHILSMAPWNGPAPSTPWDVLQADGVLQFAPWRSLVFDDWAHLRMPFWNPYQLMGTPLLANSQSAGFYPPHILLGLLHVPLYQGMTFLAWLHLFWAGLGVYLLVRRLGGTKSGGAVAGASFSLSAFMVSWTALPSVITTVSWIPWVLACILGVFQSDLFWGLAEGGFSPARGTVAQAVEESEKLIRSQKGWMAGLAASTAMMVLAGHLQFVAFGALGSVLLLLVLTARMIVMRRPSGTQKIAFSLTAGPLFKGMLALLVGVCLAAPQLFPVLAFSRLSHRRAPASASGYETYVASAIKPYEWLGLEFPKLLGDPSKFAQGESGPSAFWPQFTKRGAAFPESALAIGPIVLFLLCCLRSEQWRRGLPILLVGVLGVLIACGTPFDWLLYYGIPGWSSTGSPGRAIVLFVLAASCLAGLAIRPQDEVSSRSKPWPGILSGILTVAILVGSDLVGSSVTSFVPGFNVAPLVGKALTDALPVVALVLAMGAGVGALWLWRRDIGKPLLMAFALACPVILIAGVLRTSAPIAEGKPATSQRYAFVNADWNLFVTPRAIMPPNMATLLRMHDVAGYDSLLDRGTKALLDQANRQDSSPPENGNMMMVKPTAEDASLAQLGVSVEQIDWRGSIVKKRLDGRRATDPFGVAQIIEETSSGLALRTAGPGVLYLKDRNLPGWSATTDGTPAVLKPGPFLAIDLPAGQHTVTFRYRPPGLTAGLVFFAMGFLALLTLINRWRAGIQVAND